MVTSIDVKLIFDGEFGSEGVSQLCEISPNSQCHPSRRIMEIKDGLGR